MKRVVKFEDSDGDELCVQVTPDPALLLYIDDVGFQFDSMEEVKEVAEHLMHEAIALWGE